jgi:hypothetical protein
LLRRVVGNVGRRFAQYVVIDGKFARAPFLHEVGDLGLRCVARLKGNLPELLAAVERRFRNQPPPTKSSGTVRTASKSGTPMTLIPGRRSVGKPCASFAIASTSRPAR